MANGIEPCEECDGDGFVYQSCGCAMCPHESILGDGTYKSAGIYHKFWVRRTDGSSRPGEKHEQCVYLVLDFDHDQFAIPAARAYAAACEATRPELAVDIRALADKAERCGELGVR